MGDNLLWGDAAPFGLPVPHCATMYEDVIHEHRPRD